MPLKKITFPPRKYFVNDNDKPVYTEDDPPEPVYLNFYMVMRRALNHPDFVGSYSAIKAGNAILEELKKLDKDADTEQSITLAEEDWEYLKKALESPKQLLGDGNVMKGFGWPTDIMFQVTPYIEAVMNPTTPKEEKKTKKED